MCVPAGIVRLSSRADDPSGRLDPLTAMVTTLETSGGDMATRAKGSGAATVAASSSRGCGVPVPQLVRRSGAYIMVRVDDRRCERDSGRESLKERPA